MKTKKLTEKRVQKIIWDSLQKNSYMVMIPNFYGAFGWEADVCGLTYSGYLHEFEIKLTPEDLAHDKSKYKKMVRLKAAYMSGGDDRFLVPRHFYYVCTFWPNVGSIPDFAGAIVVDKETHELKKIRNAPALPGKKANNEQIRKMLTSFCHRYWKVKYG